MCNYINRDHVISELNKLCDRVCQYSKAQRKVMCGACPLGDAFTVIEDDILAADVRENVRGEWRINGQTAHTCSNCGTIFTFGNSYRFCPWCGADMRGEHDG